VRCEFGTGTGKVLKLDCNCVSILIVEYFKSGIVVTNIVLSGCM